MPIPPTHASANNPTNANTSSVRRNLFHSHLSRRPASGGAGAAPSSNPNHNNSIINNTTTLTSSSTTSSNHQSTTLTTSSSSATTATNIHLDNPFQPHPLHNPSHTTTTDNTTNIPSIPHNDIIARDSHGRPYLPTLPTLPTHLRLSPPTTSTTHTHTHPEASASTSSSPIPGTTLSPTELEDALTREREDKERIEKSLVEMMYRSRSRAHGHATRGAAGGVGGGVAAGGGGTGGGKNVGEGLDKMGPEGEELLALVQASLRKKVAGLEEERWMWEAEVR